MRGPSARDGIPPGIKEIDRQSRNIPDREPDLGFRGQAIEEIEAAADRNDADQPGQRRTKGSRRIGRAHAHDQHADRYCRERRKRSRIGGRRTKRLYRKPDNLH